MESVLKTLDALPHDLGKRIEMKDWNALVRVVPGSTKKQRALLFFPRQVESHEQSALQRRPEFLSNFDKKEYVAILEHLQTVEVLQFSDVRWLLQMTPAETMTMARVLEHVVDWFDEASSASRRQNGKTNAQIRDGLQSVLLKFHRTRELNASCLELEIERHSQDIESSVMGSVRENMNYFGACVVEKHFSDDQKTTERVIVFGLLSLHGVRSYPWWKIFS